MNNPCRVIKWLAFVTGFCIVSCTTALAQQSFFIFLQSDNLQPFYAQIGDKVYSSSSIGHLVIPRLQDNTYAVEVGFPHATTPLRFSIPVKGKDRGYQLIKSGTADWALYDWQTQETIKPLKSSGNSALLYGERKKDDAFATLMAAVVNDSAVLYTSVIKKVAETVPLVANSNDKELKEKQPVTKAEEKIEMPAPVDTTQAHIKAETVTAITESEKDTTALVKKDPVLSDTASQVGQTGSEPVKKDSLVTKYDLKEPPLTGKPAKENVVKVQEQTKNGETKMVFIDSSQSPADVVTVYIAEEKPSVQTPENTQSAISQTADAGETASVAIANETPKKESAQAVVTAAPAKHDAIEPGKTDSTTSTTKNDSAKTDNSLAPVNQEVEEVAKKDKEPKKDAEETTTPTKEEIAGQISKETSQSDPEKKTSTDTVTIVLESPQMKRDAAGNAEGDEKPVVKSEPAQKDTLEKATVEPVTKDTAAGVAKQETPKAVYEPKSAEIEKNTNAAPAAKKDTAATAANPDDQSLKPKPTEPVTKPEPAKQLVMINSDCIKIATDNDVDKLRVKILAENDVQKRVSIVNKAFKTMCLYAKQIKALSELFPTDEDKYNFLAAAYPFAADTPNFKQLYELFSTESYQTKFKILVRLQ